MPNIGSPNSKEIYLAILGVVYNVTDGSVKPHYHSGINVVEFTPCFGLWFELRCGLLML